MSSVVRLWQHSRTTEVVLGLIGLLAFPVSGLLLGWLYLSIHKDAVGLGFSGDAGILFVVGILLVACVLTAVIHEAIHALAMLLVGHQPRFRFATIPSLRLCVDGQDEPYERGAFALVLILPVAILSAVSIIGVALGPYAEWLIVPGAFQLTVSKMDIAYAIVARRQPAGTRFHVTPNGLEITEPVEDDLP